jgi:hypothetical protein
MRVHFISGLRQSVPARSTVRNPGEQTRIRDEAQRFEAALLGDKRKRLGQFFSGLPLGKLLAHISLANTSRTVLDPMAGHGDLLDASNEVAVECGQAIQRLDGIEVDPDVARFCRARLNEIVAGTRAHTIVCGSAFDLRTVEALPERSYDLVITNPPYVRYQAQESDARLEPVRNGLAAIISAMLNGADRLLFRTLTQAYSGLADLSVPAWILAASMVRPGGRLALVVPATWRSRQYGEIVRYLLLRCFRLEYIIEDTQPGWFSDALVRTHLVVAERLAVGEQEQPLCRKAEWPSASWLQISPEASDPRSLVGAAFNDAGPEAALARWLRSGAAGDRCGIRARTFSLGEEWASLKTRVASRPWFQKLEPDQTGLPLFQQMYAPVPAFPDVLRDIVAMQPADLRVTTLDEAGILTGQGLRTGCNRFFYVDALGPGKAGSVQVRSSLAFGNREVAVPARALQPVLRRQSELVLIETGEPPPGRVLDLRGWIVPEDAESVAKARNTYQAIREPMPEIMPDGLAAFVRLAARSPFDRDSGKAAPALSAVRTNVRPHRDGIATPRFWYMLPDFMPRHRPAAFVGRINHGAPWVECNLDPPILIDANFSTFWPADERWTGFAIKALLNSAWCQLFMEALGTPMGGGALKLEAVQLKQLSMPKFSRAQRQQLDERGRALSRNASPVLAQINAIVLDALRGGTGIRDDINTAFLERAENLRFMRLRKVA